MEDFIIPQCVDIIIESTLACSSSESAFNMRNPSIAQKLHDNLIRMADSKELLAIKSGHKNKQIVAKEFMKVMKKEWFLRVAKTSTAVAQERNCQKDQHIPNPNDIQKLSDFVKAGVSSCIYEEKNPTWTNYVRIVSLLQVRLAMYNKRRPGEIE